MKKTIQLFFLLCLPLAAWATDIMHKQKDGTYVVNTTELCKVRGYKSYTPVEVHIKAGKVVKIEPLENLETSRFFAVVVERLLPQYVGQKVSKALNETTQPRLDGCTGATLSAKAVKQNIKMALEYYRRHR